MAVTDVKNFFHRFDSDLALEFMELAVSQRAVVSVTDGEVTGMTKIRRFDLQEQNPFLILQAFSPIDANAMVRNQREVECRMTVMNHGNLYHLRFHVIFCGLREEQGLLEAVSTPPLDLKFASEQYIARTNPGHPLSIVIPGYRDEEHVHVKALAVQGLFLEDRLMADTLTLVSGRHRIRLDFGKDGYISVEGEFHEGNGSMVEFRYNRLSDSNLQMVEEYLNRIYIETRHIGAEKKTGSTLAAHTHSKTFSILGLSGDTDLVKSLKKVFEPTEIAFTAESDIPRLSRQLGRRSWLLVLVDGSFPGIDLWAFSRNLHDVSKQANVVLPPILLLSDDLSEDGIVYAQYCGIQHVYSRQEFFKNAVLRIGQATGHREWLKSGDSSKIVVIIDDDRNVTFPLEHALNRLGYDAVIFTKAMEAVQSIPHIRPCGIVLEPALRQGDGKDACRVLKRNPFTQTIPLIVLSVIKDAKERKVVDQCGVNVFLQKPMPTSEIVQEVEKRIRRGIP
jgi:CheY-like chemotaxis protein